jgi:hypothetical protein
MCLNTLEPNEPFARDYSTNFAFSDLKKHVQNLRRRKHLIALVMHMDDSRRHNGQKLVEKTMCNHVIRLDIRHIRLT